MTNPDPAQLASQIELYLLDRGGWVPVAEICARFGIRERMLRQDGHRRGLLDRCAVSSTRGGESGFIHHRFLPTREYLPVKHRILRHAVAELRKVRAWEAGRRNCLTGRPPLRFEEHTGQAVFAAKGFA